MAGHDDRPHDRHSVPRHADDAAYAAPGASGRCTEASSQGARRREPVDATCATSRRVDPSSPDRRHRSRGKMVRCGPARVNTPASATGTSSSPTPGEHPGQHSASSRRGTVPRPMPTSRTRVLTVLEGSLDLWVGARAASLETATQSLFLNPEPQQEHPVGGTAHPLRPQRQLLTGWPHEGLRTRAAGCSARVRPRSRTLLGILALPYASWDRRRMIGRI